MSPPDIAHHRGLVARWMRDPACVTWCSALDVAQAARCFGADPGAGVPMTFTDAEFEHYDEGWECVVIGSLDGWTLAIEPNGGEARSSGVLAALSRGGRAFSLYWNGPVHVELNYAVQGRFVAEVPRSPVADWPLPPSVTWSLRTSPA